MTQNNKPRGRQNAGVNSPGAGFVAGANKTSRFPFNFFNLRYSEYSSL
ncbi:hypothetical protein JOE25_000192 [Serratia sp. PL17]|nr:hypothetical protein [Serratia sp. PL17]